jgi:DnaJ-domain-containing protein 1
MALFDRLGTVVRAEWSSRFGEDDEPEEEGRRDDENAGKREPKRSRANKPAPRRAQQVTDVQSAWKVLELSPGATLDVVRESYFALAKRYHPRTLSKNADQAYAAQTVLDALTDALELLESHLLPLPDGREG